jgi:DNA-binding transcriptional regulator YdaS (Cro superfamily)
VNVKRSGVERAVEKLGSQKALAALCEQLPQAVTRWLREGKVPAKYAARIEQETGIPRRELCEDFPWDEVDRVVSAAA